MCDLHFSFFLKLIILPTLLHFKLPRLALVVDRLQRNLVLVSLVQMGVMAYLPPCADYLSFKSLW